MSTLAELPIGASAQVKHIAGADEIACRLMEMGLTPGSRLRVAGVAPLGDPIELEIRGYRLSVRKSEAQRVEIQPLL